MVRYRGRSGLIPVLLAMALSVVMSSPAAAQPRPPGTPGAGPAIGFLGGGSIDPEQAFAGVFWESPQLGGRFSLRPGIDGGFGNDLRLATVNVDFLARFELGGSGWSLVQGGGPTIVITRIPDLDRSDTSAGGSYILGFAHDSGFFTEFRIGGGNVPSLKYGAGYRITY